MSKPTVTAIEHADVRNKVLYYLKVEGGGETLLINVGQKTYSAVRAMENQMEMPLKPQKDGNKGQVQDGNNVN